MDKIYLNEMSLDGQFSSMEAFIDSCDPMIKCLNFINKQNEKVYKHSTFYKQKITQKKTFNDLRGAKGDKARKLKILLLSTTDNPPFWDEEDHFAQDLESTYIYNKQDVSATSVAEAAEERGMLLSFSHDQYRDCKVAVKKNDQHLADIHSVYSTVYMSDRLLQKQEIEIHDYLKMKYEGTRLDFTSLEAGYGLENFEKSEIQDCLESFDRFVTHESWEDIAGDTGLYYKSYEPASKSDNWFHGAKYKDLDIYKFRCKNPKRCFGYRKNDVFHVLRMERDHKISDNG